MFKKIILGILLFIISINISTATTIDISDSAFVSNSATDNTVRSPQYTCPLPPALYVNVDYGNPIFSSVTVDISKWDGSALNSRYDSEVTFRIGGVVVGNGSIGFTKSDDGTLVFVQIWFWDTNGFSSYSGWQTVYIQNWEFQNDIKGRHPVSGTSFSDDIITVFDIPNGTCGSPTLRMSGTHYTMWEYDFSNTLKYYDNTTYFYVEYFKSSTDTSKVTITQSDIDYILYNDLSLNANNFSIINSSLEYTTWDYSVLNPIGRYINGSFAFREAPTTTPFLITNKTNYLTSEDILISWGNILNLPLAYTPATLELQIKYTEGTKEYLKWNEILDYHEYDGNRIVSASYFIPQTNYTLYITDAEFPDIPLYHTTFNVKQTNDDYITTNKNYPPHQVYSGQTIQIYYQAQNTSKLNIVDDDNNLVSSYTVSGIGTKNYNIPTDIEKSYSYPYWYVYLNDTVTSISLNQSIKVVWVSEPQITPTIPPTVQKTPIVTDSNTTEILTELKNGTKPLIDLVYGIGFIFVDNPDYDDNSVVSIDEMNQWFNSLVKVGIFILLITFYYGFKREEQLRK